MLQAGWQVCRIWRRQRQRMPPPQALGVYEASEQVMPVCRSVGMARRYSYSALVWRLAS